MNFIRKMLKSEKGATAIEYGLIAALIVAVRAAEAARGRRSMTVYAIAERSCESCAVTLHRLGGVGGLVGGAPQDRGAAFGRDHRIDRMLEHQHPVGGGDRDRAARAALRRRSRRSSARPARGIARSSGRSPRPGRAPRPGPRERRPACRPGSPPAGRSGRPAHQPDRLAIAFGLGHAEIVLEAAGGVVALLMADQHHLAAVDPARPPMIAGSSAKARSPASGMKSSAMPAT
jgi:pilus assembly protein Flp/PilA